MIGRRKKKLQDRLDDARRERAQVRREGELNEARVKRLERRARENHFAELAAEALRRRRRA